MVRRDPDCYKILTQRRSDRFKRGLSLLRWTLIKIRESASSSSPCSINDLYKRGYCNLVCMCNWCWITKDTEHYCGTDLMPLLCFLKCFSFSCHVQDSRNGSNKRLETLFNPTPLKNLITLCAPVVIMSWKYAQERSYDKSDIQLMASYMWSSDWKAKIVVLPIRSEWLRLCSLLAWLPNVETHILSLRTIVATQ